MTRRNVIVGLIVVAVLAAPIAWYLASPLFIDRTVDEAFPFDVPTMTEIGAMSPNEAGESAAAIVSAMDAADLTDDQMGVLEERLMEMSSMMPDQEVTDVMPADGEAWVPVSQGMFRDFDSVHRGSGTATVFQLGDRRVLRFEDFEATNGPDLHVLLVENVDATGRDNIGAYVDLGSLKGNVGNQNYEIPDDVDLGDFAGVMIYCMPFHVVFSTAPLS